MKASLDYAVRQALANHLARTTESVLPAHRLRRDLELLPFDLVLIAQRLEDIGTIRLSPRALESAHTVAELTSLFESCAA